MKDPTTTCTSYLTCLFQIPTSKLKKFLTPSSDDELSEELSPVKEEKNMHDSPNSCVIPPPLKPPRSWDLIQAGMIDDNTVRKQVIKCCN